MKKTLIINNEPKSPISECFRALRTNIQFKNSNKQLKTILVTSTMQSEGKSTITSNLAVAFAQTGKKTLIIDADMRKAKLHKIFGVEQYPGFANYLLGLDENGNSSELTIDKYVKETEIKNLSILTAGSIPPNPSELLALNKVKYMIDNLKKQYDIIILDSTPCMLVTDAIILSRIADTTLILTSYNETKMDNLKRVKRDIENVGGNIAGIILNKVPATQNKYSYYYGEGKQINSVDGSGEVIDIENPKDVDYIDNVTENIGTQISNDVKTESIEFRDSYLEIVSDINGKIKSLDKKILGIELKLQENLEESKIVEISNMIKEKLKTLECKILEIELKPEENIMESKIVEIANSISTKVKLLEEKIVELELKPKESYMELKISDSISGITEKLSMLEAQIFEVETNKNKKQEDEEVLKNVDILSNEVKQMNLDLHSKIEELENKIINMSTDNYNTNKESNIIEIADVIKSKNDMESIWWTKPEKKVKLYEIEIEIGKRGKQIIREINDSMVVYEKQVK